MNTIRSLRLFLTGVALVFVVGAAAAQERRSMLDGDVLAAEAGAVNLVTNSSGRVVQVKVADCEQCAQLSYLPASDLEVTQSGNPEFSGALRDVSGQGGTVVLEQRSGMVTAIIFWMPSNEGAE